MTAYGKCPKQAHFLLQIMSIEDVERIMDETKEGVEYQRVGLSHVLLYAFTYNTVRYVMVQYGTVQFGTVQYGTVWYFVKMCITMSI